MLYSGKHSAFLDPGLIVRLFGLLLIVVRIYPQIKYLRVPDTLLDAVKEEQNRARDAGRNARGAHVGGGRGGMSVKFSVLNCHS